MLYCSCVTVPSPAQCPEPGQVVGMVHAVADGDDFMEALDLNTEDLQGETPGTNVVCENVHPLSGCPSDTKWLTALFSGSSLMTRAAILHDLRQFF